MTSMTQQLKEKQKCIVAFKEPDIPLLIDGLTALSVPDR